MGGSGLEIKDIRLLHLSRNIPSLLTLPENGQQSDGTETVRFSMFDYFDRLSVKKGAALDHMACLGLEPKNLDSARQSVSSQYLTLVSLEGEQKVSGLPAGLELDDPFFYGEDDGFSKLPFLSVMIVTTLPIPGAEEKCEDFKPYTSQSEVDAFLKSCAEELRELVQDTCRKISEAGTSKTEGIQAVFQVYHCINSGNFCIAVRSQSPELAYHISMEVRATTLNKKKSHNFPALDCSTFSLVGLEYYGEQNGAEAPIPQSLKSSRSKVALRLSVTNQVRNDLLCYAPDFVSEDINGLYGRYDVTLRLELEQFWRIYPWICAHKFGVPFPQKDIPEQGASIEEGDGKCEIIRLLKQAMRGQGIQCINARLLVNTALPPAPQNNGERRRTRQAQVREENKQVVRQIGEVLQLAEQLPYCQEEYQKCLYLLWDLWRSYSSLRYQDDSFISGNMLLAQISLLLDTIRHYVKSMNPAQPNEIYYQDLITNLKNAIESISHFQKLMLSINQQSIQAPNYEVQMHTDMEKFVVAYTEFSRRFLAEHFPANSSAPDGNDALKQTRQRLFPIITVNIVKPAIQATPLFLLPYQIDFEKGLVSSNKNQEQIFLSIETPDSDIFGNLYATLPLICHELFHNFRIIDRDKRNDVLSKFILRRVAQDIVLQWMFQVNDTASYTAFGALERRLFTDKLTTLLTEDYQTWAGDAHKTANIGVLISNILFFLTENVFGEQENQVLQRPGLMPEQIKRHISQLCGMALEVMGGREPVWRDAYQECCDFLDEHKDDKESCGIQRWLEKHLPRLIRAMALDILNEYSTRLSELGLKFKKQVEAIEGEYPEYSIRINDYLLKACDPGALLKGVCLPPDRTDRWISELYQGYHAISREAQSFFEKHCAAGHEQLQELRLTEQMLGHEVSNFCRAIKDADHLGLLLLGSLEYGNIQNQGARKELIRKFRQAVQMELDRYCKDREDCGWVLYSAPQMQELIVPLCSDLDDKKLFSKQLNAALDSISRTRFEQVAKQSTILYREVFADLGMCGALKLNTFGYLRVLARKDVTFCQGCRESKAANMKLERMLLVSKVLLSQPDGAEWRVNPERLEQVRADCRSSAEIVLSTIEQAMRQESRQDADWLELRRRIEDRLNCRTRVRGIPRLEVTIGKFWGWFEKERQDVCQKLYQQLRALWNLVYLVNYLSERLSVGWDHSLTEHFAGLFQQIQDQWRPKENRPPESSMLERVGCAYNDPGANDLQLQGQEIFKDTLSFVLYYYYHSWNVYGRGIQKGTSAEEWLKTLMGGVPQ